MYRFTKIVGVLNITPDSFSDGGDFLDATLALQRAKKMREEGADIIDIGAESTAPHNAEISEQEEWERLENILPVLLSSGIPISLDSQKSGIWQKFLELGGNMINDVSGLGRTEEEQQKKIELLQKFPNVKIVVMFSRDISSPDPENLKEAIIPEISAFFQQKMSLLEKNGISKSRIILDTGMGGFLSKNPEISFHVLRNFSEFSGCKDQGCELYLGTSRKSFLSEVSQNASPDKRVISSIVSSVLGIQNGADYVRVHDVHEMKIAMNTLKAIQNTT